MAGTVKNVIYLSNEDYETLVTTGTVTIGDTTLTYDEDNLYITPEKEATTTEAGLMSASDKVKLNGLKSGTQLYKHTLTNSQSLQITIISFDSTPLTGWPSPSNKFEYLYARLGDYKKIIAFYVDDSEYVEKAYYVNDFDLGNANNMYGTFTLGTFVGDTVTPL